MRPYFGDGSNTQGQLTSTLLFSPTAYLLFISYSKACVERPHSKRPKIGFQDQLSLDEGQKYCRTCLDPHLN